MAKVTIDQDVCKGCGLCIAVCPKGIIKLSETQLNTKGYSPAEITDMDACTGCASCARMCPDVALTVER